MRLSDIMSQMGLSSWTEVALLVFLAVFVAQAVWLMLPRNRALFEEAGRLPFEDGTHDSPRTSRAGTTAQQEVA